MAEHERPKDMLTTNRTAGPRGSHMPVIAVVLFLALVGSPYWIAGSRSVSTDDILRQAQAGPAVHSAVLTEVLTSQTSSGERRTEGTTWYQAPDRWRYETRHTALPQDDRVLVPTVIVSDGTSWWQLYRDSQSDKPSVMVMNQDQLPFRPLKCARAADLASGQPGLPHVDAGRRRQHRWARDSHLRCQPLALPPGRSHRVQRATGALGGPADSLHPQG